MPFLSVIIPIYNVEKYVEQCINSVINQQLSDIEIILVDDGSPDSCPQICDNYAQKYDFVQVIHKRNGGLSSARNKGIDTANGKYIIFVDSDDWWNPEVDVKEIVKRVSENPEIEMFLFSSLDYVEGEGLFKRKEHERLKNVSTDTIDEYYQGLLRNGNLEVSANTKIFRTDFLKKNHLYFQEGITSEDSEWILRVLRKLNFVKILNVPLYICRMGRKGSISNSIGKKNIDNLLRIIEQSVDYYKGQEESNLKKYELCYCAYLWFCALGLSNSLSTQEIKQLKNLFKKTSCVCKYSDSKKTRMSYMIYRIFGFRGSMKILGIYLKVKRKINLNKRKQ